MSQAVATAPVGHYGPTQVLKSEIIKVALPSPAMTLGVTRGRRTP